MCASVSLPDSSIEAIHLTVGLFRLSILMTCDANFNLSCLFDAFHHTWVIFIFLSTPLLLSLSSLLHSTPFLIYLIPHHIVAVKHCNYKRTKTIHYYHYLHHLLEILHATQNSLFNHLSFKNTFLPACDPARGTTLIVPSQSLSCVLAWETLL